MSTVIYRIEVQGFGEAKNDLQFLTTETKKLNTEKARLNTESRAAARAITAEQGSIEALRAQTALLRQQANQMRVTNEQEAKARQVVINKVNQNTIAIRNHDRAMSGSNTLVGEYSRGIMSSMKKIGGAMLGLGGGIAIIMKLTQALKNMVSTSVDFEKSMSRVQAISMLTDEQMVKLTESAISLGGSTKFTASQVGKLQEELGKLGFLEQQILNMTAGILDLAAATDTELGEAATIAGATLRQFSLDSTEMGRVVDVITLSLARSALDMNSFAKAMAVAGPVAATVGETIESTAAKLSVLANRGLDASMSGTSLRNIFLELQKQGLTFDQAMDKINGSTNKATTALDMFGKRAAVAGIILAQTAEETASLNAEYNEATGTAKGMATVMQDNVAGSVIKLTSAWEGLILRINNTNGAIKIFIDGITTILGGIGTEGFKNLNQLFDPKPIENFNDKFSFFIAMGMGYNKAAKMARQNSIEEVQVLKDEFVEIGKVRDAKARALAEETEAIQRTAREKREAELAIAQEAIDAAEKIEAAKKKAWEAEQARIKKGEEQRLANLIKHVEDATKDNKMYEPERLGVDTETETLRTIATTQIDIEKAKQDRITQITEEGENKRKLTYEEGLTLQMAALDGITNAVQSAFNNRTRILQEEMAAELQKENLTEKQKQEIKKKYYKEQQKLDIKRALINAALGITKTFVEYGFTPAGWVAAAALAIENAFQIGAIKAQKYATGGLVQGGIKIKPDRNGDDTLIVAKQGEVVLTEKHQQLLGGAETFKRIGVKGFAEGGVVGSISQSDGVGYDYSFMVQQIVKGFNDKKVILSLPELARAESKMDLVIKSSEL